MRPLTSLPQVAVTLLSGAEIQSPQVLKGSWQGLQTVPPPALFCSLTPNAAS